MKRKLYRAVICTALMLHHFLYRLVGKLSPGIEPDGLHPKHRLMRYHDWFTERLDPGWNVLDIGCGNGALADSMASYCRSVTGIDVVEKNIGKANQRVEQNNTIFICADATEYDFKERFDAIILSNVLEHIEDRVVFLKRIYKNQDMKNPPILLLRVPMITRDWLTLYKKELGVEWRLDRTHFTEYTLDQIVDETRRAGLEIENYDIQFGEFYGILRPFTP